MCVPNVTVPNKYKNDGHLTLGLRLLAVPEHFQHLCI